MKKIFLSLGIFFIINLNLNALTMKEKIQQDLSKVGVKQEIIDETVKLDKETGEGFTTKNEDGEVSTEDKDKWEKVYLKDKRNYVALERLIASYYLTGTENDLKKEKYVSEYLKMNLPEDRKNFFLGKYFWISLKGKSEKNKYFEKVKSISNNEYYLKVIDFADYLVKESKNIKENKEENLKISKQKIDEIVRKMDEIDKILDNKNLKEKYRISDEEAYSEQLDFFLAGGLLKAFTGDLEGTINDFINKIGNKKVSKEVSEYNKNKEMMTVFGVQMAGVFKGFFGEMSEKEMAKLEKLSKKLQETEMFKRVMENSENNAGFEFSGDTESDIHREEKKRKFEELSDDEQIKQIVHSKKFDYIEARIDDKKKIFNWTFGCDGLNCELAFLGKNKDFEKKIKLKDLAEKEKIVRMLIFGKKEEPEEISEGVFRMNSTDTKDNKFYVYDEDENTILYVFFGQSENLDFFKFVNKILGENYKNIEAKYKGKY